MKSDEALLKWLKLLIKYGFSIVKNSPIEKKSAFKILNRILVKFDFKIVWKFDESKYF